MLLVYYICIFFETEIGINYFVISVSCQPLFLKGMYKFAKFQNMLSITLP